MGKSSNACTIFCCYNHKAKANIQIGPDWRSGSREHYWKDNNPSSGKALRQTCEVQIWRKSNMFDKSWIPYSSHHVVENVYDRSWISYSSHHVVENVVATLVWSLVSYPWLLQQVDLRGNSGSKNLLWVNIFFISKFWVNIFFIQAVNICFE